MKSVSRALCSLLLSPLISEAAITVNGISDEAVVANLATFEVPSETGFTIEALLNDEAIALDSQIEVVTPGYYELAVTKTNNGTTSEESVLIQFIVRDTSRGNSEWGLVNWTPYPTLDSAPQSFSGGELEMISPSVLPLGYSIPMIFRLQDAISRDSLRLNGRVGVADSKIRILRGFGSGFLSAPVAAGVVNLTPDLHGLGSPHAVQIEQTTTWTTVSTDLTTSIDWGENARIHFTSDLTVGDGVTLTIGAGSIVQLAAGVDIELDGKLLVNGTTNNPVLFTNVPGESPWGGFFLRGANSQVNAAGAIFTGSGANSSWFSGSGFSAHRKEQATFLFDTGTAGSFVDCFFIDLPGQALHGRNATIDLTDCLIQRLPTVGQFNGGAVTVTRSGLIEFPFYGADFNDDDNDGIYFTAGSHRLIDTLIGWAKDDGVDAGSGNSGDVIVAGCWFEACFHEGMAWSGEGRRITVSDTVAMNCGQGIEAGWSGSSTNGSPVVNVTNSLCIGNHIGLRFGDNYDWAYDGQLNVSNSLSLHNDRNVWGFEWDSWNYRSEKMDIQNNKLSEADSRHPLNTVFDSAADSALLVPFSPVPGVEVGCGFGEWNFQRSMADYGEEITISLSEVSTAPVSIDYEIATNSGVISTGVAHFSAGEIRKTIEIPSLDPLPDSYVRVTLLGASGGEITTPRSLFYLSAPGSAGSSEVLIPTGAAWRYLDDGSDQGVAWQALVFDDSTWLLGNAELGYGEGDEDTEINGKNASDETIATSYFRHSFTAPNPDLFGSLDIRILRDDGAIVYLNGVEEFRSNIDPGPIVYDDFTVNITQSGDEDLFFEQSISASKLRQGVNVIAVEVHQATATSSDVSFDFELIVNPAVPLTFRLLKAGGELNLLWRGEEGLTLQSSQHLNGDWVNLAGAVSPLIVVPNESASSLFFRLVK
ncbi:MAG: hypothetical protein QNL33_05305 [Akkermansiaceae bacterium]|jgi:hypothetical protein